MRTLGPWKLNTVHNEDCLAALMAMPSDCVDVVVTSPPYWGQRGSAGVGSEADPRDYVASLCRIFTECIRCLKPTGTLWLNMGDTYNTPMNWSEKDYHYSTLGADRQGFDASNKGYTKNRGSRRAFIDKQAVWLQYGNLLALPYRLILQLCDAGALFRGEVIWEKTKPMPEGLCRRPHRRHESIYIIAKSERHLFRVKPPVGSVWRLVQTPHRGEHCSAFPIDLPLQCIAAAAPQMSPVILDPFMGSGTTARAAQRLGHDWIGFELDRRHCAIANASLDGPDGPNLFTNAQPGPQCSRVRTDRADC